MLRTLVPSEHRAEAGAHILALLFLIGLVLANRIQAPRIRNRLRTALGLVGLVTGSFASLLARRSAMLSDRLVEEQERRQTLVASVAHELHNRITPVMAYAQILERHPGVPTELEKQAAASLVRQTRLLNRLVSDLSDASRIQTRRLSLQVKPMDLVPVVRRVVEAEQLTTEQHVIALHAPPHLEGVWDADRVAQALTNLVNNAIKYSPEGGDITVAISQTYDEAMICVTDQGIGLAPEDLPLLFEPYSRVYRERRAKGLGLGLYITYGIVEAHGGRIWATSPGPGQGSTFCFTLPLP